MNQYDFIISNLFKNCTINVLHLCTASTGMDIQYDNNSF